MWAVLLYSTLLILGLAGSQVLPAWSGAHALTVAQTVKLGTMFCLAYIMIRVGMEFQIDRSNLRQYGWDYVVAFTAATVPWILVTGYFVFVLMPAEARSTADGWIEALLAGRFAAPTSAGVLFSMLAAAGLATTWLFRKARVLAIFDDLDTVLLMIPLKMLMVGLAWQLGFILLVVVVLLVIGFQHCNRLRWPISWPWVLLYSAVITAVCEKVYIFSKMVAADVPVHIEVLLPAFILGVILRPAHAPAGEHPEESPSEARAATVISAVFMLLVGLSMPALGTSASSLGWGAILWHVLMVTLLSNLGKMCPALCYRREAHWRERLAVAVGMWPRGEVGAGVLAVSLSYGISGEIVTVAMLSLSLNLALTGVFIWIIRLLIAPVYAEQSRRS